MAGLALGMSAGVFFLLERPASQGPVATSAQGRDSSRVAVADTNPTDSVKPVAKSGDTLRPTRTATLDTSSRNDTASWQVAWADDDILLKGASHRLAIHRIAKADAQAVRLSDRDSAWAGDLLQVGTLAGPKRFVAILSLDGNGQVTRHLPESGDSSQLVATKQQAPHSYQLDDAPRFERFVLVESRSAFDLASVEALLKKAGASGAIQSKGLRIESILLNKKP